MNLKFPFFFSLIKSQKHVTYNNYGVIKIRNVKVVNGEAVSFEIDYAEGR